MAKRSRSDTEIAEDPAQSHMTDGIKAKKHKVKESGGPLVDDAASKLSKEERREMKRLGKHKRVRQLERSGTNGVFNGEIAKAVDRSAEKAARKAEKERLKSIMNGPTEEKGSGISPSEDAPAEEEKHIQDGDGVEARDKIAAKAARKAEKKRLKPLKDSTRQEENRISKTNQGTKEREHKDLSKSHDVEAVDEAAVKAQWKAEKKRVRALQNSKEHGNPESAKTLPDVSDQSLPTPNTTLNPQSDYTEDLSLTTLPQAKIDSFLSDHFVTITDPSTPTTLRPITSFSYLPQSTDTSPFANFRSPTPIQSAAWPFLLSGRDVIGVAETGSGKTLAFGVPCIRALANLPQPQKSHGPVARAVMVSPTRELAVQIHDQIAALAAPTGLKTVCVYGGVPKPPQIVAARTAHIIIATPGRLNDLISEGSADLSGVTYLVLDEADRMLDKGFEDEIRKIISCCPSTGMGRQTAMFTATWPPSVRDLAATFMRDPVHISIGDNHGGELRANTRIEQRVEVVDPRGKEQRLLQIIKQHQSGKNSDDRILVFCLYKKEATRVEGFLRSKGLRVAGIHGDMSQENRSRSLESFKSGACPLLVATDVAARGLDIPSVKLVLNCTFPLTVEDYVHRIGRYVSLPSITSLSISKPILTTLAGQEEREKKAWPLLSSPSTIKPNPVPSLTCSKQRDSRSQKNFSNSARRLRRRLMKHMAHSTVTRVWKGRRRRRSSFNWFLRNPTSGPCIQDSIYLRLRIPIRLYDDPFRVGEARGERLHSLEYYPDAKNIRYPVVSA